ncbi:MAG: hypothetical protein OXF25_08790 [Cyanobacteria bacterium MAG CAR3_bin_5]|nr:hypothetical protein [Cyanobacteria bacterium MAG CAR3_bin_5]MCY4235731.1 hypothetical protein [Cyanobacteria bacterium MAG CAR2_bin_4]
MLSSFAKVILTATAIAPAGLTYACAACMAGKTGLAIGLLCGSFICTIVCLFLLGYARNRLEQMQFTATKVEAADHENMAILLLYLSPLFTANFNALNWPVLILTLLIFALVIGTRYGYHFNPLLGLQGWHFYKVATPEGVTYVLITKKRLRDARGKLVVGLLTEYIVLDLE